MHPNLCIYGTLAPFVHSGGFETLCRIRAPAEPSSIQSLWAHQLKWKWCCCWELVEKTGATQTSGLRLIPTRSPLKQKEKKKKKSSLAESCDKPQAKYCVWQGRVRQCCGCQTIGRVEKWHGDDRPLRRRRKGFKVFLRLMSVLYEGWGNGAAQREKRWFQR